MISVTEESQGVAVEGERDLVRSNFSTQNNFKDKLFLKKVAKVEKLKIKGETKKYKRYILTKMFREDDQNLPKYKKIERATILAKLKLARQDDEDGSAIDPVDLIKEVEDGNLSDLRPEEIPDDQVSDVEITATESLE